MKTHPNQQGVMPHKTTNEESASVDTAVKDWFPLHQHVLTE